MSHHHHIKSQQSVMKALGYYDGAVDGIWGPKSLAAKRKWESSGQFAPAVPSHGMPFEEKHGLPSGVKRTEDGTVTCPNAQPVAADEVVVDPPVVAPVVDPVVENVEASIVVDAQVVSAVTPDTAAAAAAVVDPAAVVVDPPVVDPAAAGNAGRSSRLNRNR